MSCSDDGFLRSRGRVAQILRYGVRGNTELGDWEAECHGWEESSVLRSCLGVIFCWKQDGQDRKANPPPMDELAEIVSPIADRCQVPDDHRTSGSR
jgi:hypothetical protein